MPTVTIHNAITGETIVREMTPDELAQHEIDKAESEAREAERKAAEAEEAAKRQSAIDKLTALGLTEDEAKIIAGGV